MKAVRGNKEYTISKAQEKAYQDAGYDILDDAGGVVAHGRGKTVPYEEYAAVEAENERLRQMLSETASAEKKGKAAGKAGG